MTLEIITLPHPSTSSPHLPLLLLSSTMSAPLLPLGRGGLCRCCLCLHVRGAKGVRGPQSESDRLCERVKQEGRRAQARKPPVLLGKPPVLLGFPPSTGCKRARRDLAALFKPVEEENKQTHGKLSELWWFVVGAGAARADKNRELHTHTRNQRKRSTKERRTPWRRRQEEDKKKTRKSHDARYLVLFGAATAYRHDDVIRREVERREHHVLRFGSRV